VTLLVMLVVVLAAALVVVLVPLVTEPIALVTAFLTESRIPPCASAAAADAGHTTASKRSDYLQDMNVTLKS
jgi:hypothetical protein